MKKTFILFLFLSFSNIIFADTFDNVISIFETKCQSCHSSTNSEAGLDLSGSKSEIFNNIFEKTTTNEYASTLEYKIVDAGYPERSTIFRTINNGLYDNVALTSVEDVHAGLDIEIEDWEKELIRQWIYHGAKQNGNIASGRKNTLIEYYTEGGLPRMEKPEPPAEGEGFQLYLGTIFLEPGQEWEMVYNYSLKNPEAFEVNKIDVMMSDFSHHFLFFDYFNDNFEDVDDGFRTIDYFSFITGSAISLGESGTNMIAGWAYSSDIDLPLGTAFTWEEDLVLKFNYHLKNYSNTQVYPADLYVNVYTQETGTAIKEMYSDFLINGQDFIGNSIPSTCDTIVNADFRNDFSFGSSNDTLHIWNLGAHTHALGVDYDLYTAQGGEKVEQVYEGMYNYDADYFTGFYDFAEPTFRYFDEFLSIRKGDGLIQEGKFVNCTGSTVGYGLTTEDEMLGFFSQYLVGDLTELYAYQDSIANVSTNNSTAITNNNQINVNVTPNPSEGVFNVSFDNITNEKTLIEVFDIAGKLIFQDKLFTNNISLDLSNFNTGVYILNISNSNSKISKKITKL